MKLAYILKWFPKASETFVLDELLAHQKAEVPLTVFSLLHSPDDMHQDYVQELRVPIQYAPETAIEQKAQWISRRCAGVTHIHAQFAASATTAAALVSKITRIPYSFTAYARDIYHRDVSTQDLAEKLSSARFCITVSQDNHRYLRSINPQANIKVLYTGLALERFPFRPMPREPFVLGVGRLVAKKGFSTLARACPSRYPLHIIGDGPERPNLQGAHLHGFLSRTAAYGWIRRAGLLVLPCCIAPDGDRDGIPTVLSEGMAAGTPVLATRLVGIPEVCKDLVEPDRPDQLQAAIERMMQRPPSQEALWETRKWLETHCDVDKQMAAFRSLL
jgi:glycosyltransferase involved in cell wall biosynthesis